MDRHEKEEKLNHELALRLCLADRVYSREKNCFAL